MTPTQPPEPAASIATVEKFANFGAAVWLWLADQWSGISEDAWDIAEMSVEAGLSERVAFDPNKHTSEDVEPGDMIVWPLVGDVSPKQVRAALATADALHTPSDAGKLLQRAREAFTATGFPRVYSGQEVLDWVGSFAPALMDALESVTRERDEAQAGLKWRDMAIDGFCEMFKGRSVEGYMKMVGEHAAAIRERDDLKRQLEEAQDRHRAAFGVIAAVHMALGEDPGSDNDDLPEIVATLRRVAGERSELADALAAEVAKLREALEKYAVNVAPLSYHGEMIQCEMCGADGTRAGRKRGVGDSPIVHNGTCPLATPSGSTAALEAVREQERGRIAESLRVALKEWQIEQPIIRDMTNVYEEMSGLIARCTTGARTTSGGPTP